MRAICPGSFDPCTHGHLDIIRRTAVLFDEVVVGVGNNTAKNGLFAPAERVEMLTEALEGVAGVRVTLISGLLVDFCAEQGIGAIVKGLRFASDFDYELQMAQMNHRLTGIETILLPTAAEWSFVSSTLVREIAQLGGDVAEFVPAATAARIAARVAERNEEKR
ncbi:pantetheine-phosphate adenylyltransferase [Naumannella sp. ID2617S]|uniref:Phosphopantetheine adenylyltransferase n=1 Tax=Enemella dayhoffiae TaxID=2016507 RepID=A0A255GNB6_9ACTN|nr:pantetheine-phosphate adenylyltransferase [Enemella dayhoffiae]NNG19577.1 pantetheine-phosphate adenylyltransferase [Naumannella sp. ID2617S]OYO17305.1 pantetheine-phosphate adenylyltransferase [Enemella dayhoffiae]